MPRVVWFWLALASLSAAGCSEDDGVAASATSSGNGGASSATSSSTVGTGGEGGAEPVNCPTCSGYGKVRAQQGFFTIERTCPTCGGRG